MGTTPFVPQRRDTAYVKPELPPARPWYATRPGETVGDPLAPRGNMAGPDAGYVFRLTRLFQGRLVPGAADRGDANAAAAAIAMRRAAAFGRGPVAGDLEAAYLLTGVLEDAPGDWTAQGADVARRIEGVRYDAHRAAAVAAAVDGAWLEEEPADIRRRLVSEGPDSIFVP